MMEAKDTVMSEATIKHEYYEDHEFSQLSPMAKAGIKDMFYDHALFFNWIAQKQAETSFKAGYKQGVKDQHECQQIDLAEAEQRGIQKVVDWVEEHHAIYPCQYGLDHYDDKGNEVLIHQKPCLNCAWRAFLKSLEKPVKERE